MVTINVHLIFLLFNWGKIKLCSAKSLQSCLTLCDLMEQNPPDSSFQGLLLQEYRSEVPCPPPGGLPNPGIQQTSLTPASAGRFSSTSTTSEAHKIVQR